MIRSHRVLLKAKEAAVRHMPWAVHLKRQLFGCTSHYVLMAIHPQEPSQAVVCSPEVTVRPGGREDVEWLCTHWPPEFDPIDASKLRAIILRRFRDAVPCLIACNERDLLGAVWCDRPGELLRGLGRPDLADASQVRNLFTTPSARCRGVGLALLHACIREAARQGRSRLYSLIEDHRLASVRLHEAAGFVHLGVVRETNRRRRTVSFVPTGNY